MPSGGGGGSVVQTIDPNAYVQADLAQQAAVHNATSQFQQGVQDAIKSLRNQYQVSTQNLQPYTQAGVQALDRYNYFLGLNPYDPGAEPTRPTAPTLEAIKSSLTDEQVREAMKKYLAFGDKSDISQKAYGKYFGAGSEVGGGYDWAGSPIREKGIQKTGFYTPDASDILYNMDYFNKQKDFMANQMLQDQQRQYEQDQAKFEALHPDWKYANDLKQQYAALGPLTTDQLQATVAAQPGYAAELGQGLAAIQNAASAGNQLGSGRTLAALSQFGQNTMSKYYGNMLSQLAQLAGAGQQSASQVSNTNANLGNNIAGLQNSLGTNLGNAQLALGNSAAQSQIGRGTSYQQMGGGGMDLGGLGSLIGSVAPIVGGAFGGPGGAAAGAGLAGLFGG